MFENMKRMPDAYAQVRGNKDNPKIRGNVYFYDVHGGTMVIAEIYGIPLMDKPVSGNFHGFHIHSGDSCTGDVKEPFKNAGSHLNPDQTGHPNHVGDLPPLIACKDMAWSAVYTDRFHPEDVVGKTIIIHEMADDFHTQPSGNAGAMIACGEIVD